MPVARSTPSSVAPPINSREAGSLLSANGGSVIANDLVRSNTFYLTHEFISHMLGAPRTGVTMAAGALQKMVWSAVTAWARALPR